MELFIITYTIIGFLIMLSDRDKKPARKQTTASRDNVIYYNFQYFANKKVQ